MQNNKGYYYTPPIEQVRLGEINEYELKRKNQKSELMKIGFVLGGAIMAYLIVQTLVSSILYLNADLMKLYETSPLFQSCFTIIGVHFASLLLPFSVATIILRKSVTPPLIPMKKMGAMRMLAWVGTGMLACIGANYFVSIVMMLVEKCGYKLTQGEALEPNDALSCIAVMVGTAIVPALIEEFAMRCCSLSILRKYGKGFGVFVVSVIFGLLHGNVIQFIFTFLIGLVLAYATIRTDNILPAVLIHACNNGLSALTDVLNYALNKDVTDTVVLVAFISWAVIGVIGVIYLMFKKELLPPKAEKAPREPYALSFGVKLACLIPGFALPFLTLIVLTITTIKKI